ncbi:MAG: hypothetical protein LBM20_02110 [Rikenellaceae bacterium]|jgi:hypothetical protein|nr:hypothetical protein [Rikenellaceae bacterium]
MKNLFALLALSAILVGGTSCASIFSYSTNQVTLTSTPLGANVTVVNRAGKTIFSGTTPAEIRLNVSAGYMKPEQYTVTFEKEGGAQTTIPLLCNVNGWYFGNILIGGLIGMLVIDPLTGAMFKLATDYVHADLRTEIVSVSGRELRILDISQVPEGAELVRLN